MSRIDAENAREIVAGFDIVLDGSDNFATRYAVSDACFHEKKPLVTASISRSTAPTISPPATPSPTPVSTKAKRW